MRLIINVPPETHRRLMYFAHKAGMTTPKYVAVKLQDDKYLGSKLPSFNPDAKALRSLLTVGRQMMMEARKRGLLQMETSVWDYVVQVLVREWRQMGLEDADILKELEHAHQQIEQVNHDDKAEQADG